MKTPWVPLRGESLPSLGEEASLRDESLPSLGKEANRLSEIIKISSRAILKFMKIGGSVVWGSKLQLRTTKVTQPSVALLLAPFESSPQHNGFTTSHECRNCELGGGSEGARSVLVPSSFF